MTSKQVEDESGELDLTGIDDADLDKVLNNSLTWGGGMGEKYNCCEVWTSHEIIKKKRMIGIGP